MAFVIIHKRRICQARSMEANFLPLTKTLREITLDYSGKFYSGSVLCYLCDRAHVFNNWECFFFFNL